MSKIEKIEIKCDKVTNNPPVSLLIDREKGKVVGIDYCRGMEFGRRRLAHTLEYSKEKDSCYYNSHDFFTHDCLFEDLSLNELEKYLKIPEPEPVSYLRHSLERCCNCGDLTAWLISPEQTEIKAFKELGFTVGTAFDLFGTITLTHILCGNCNTKRVNERNQIDIKYGLFWKDNKK